MSTSIYIYLLQSGLCLFAFYAFYFLVLKNENYHQLNRLYLVSGLILSLSIPLFQFSINESTPLIVETIVNIDEQIESTATEIFTPSIEETSSTFSLSSFLLFIYLGGVLFLSIRLLVGLIKIRKLIASGMQTNIDGYTLIETESEHSVFSFFNTILWSKLRDYSSHDEEQIIAHEKVHIQEMHSLDLILCELIQIFMWFNPIIYLYKRSLKNVHEFIADQKTFSNYNLNYVELLIKEATLQQQGSLPAVSTFFNNQIKKRLTMIKNSKKQSNKIKLAGALPILAALIFSFCCEKTNAQLDSTQLYYTIVDYEMEFTPSGERRSENEMKEIAIERAKYWDGVERKKENIHLVFTGGWDNKTIEWDSETIETIFVPKGIPLPKHHPILKEPYWTRMTKEGKLELTLTETDQKYEVLSFDATINKPIKSKRNTFESLSTSFDGDTLDEYALNYIAKIDQSQFDQSNIVVRNLIVEHDGLKYFIPTKTRINLAR